MSGATRRDSGDKRAGEGKRVQRRRDMRERFRERFRRVRERTRGGGAVERRTAGGTADGGERPIEEGGAERGPTERQTKRGQFIRACCGELFG